MTSRTRWIVLAVLLVTFGVTVVVAGQPGDPPPLPGVQRLGPDPGERVEEYQRRAAESLPPQEAEPVWALVQLDDHLDPVSAAALIAGRLRLSGVVVRVPLPRVQTALTTRDLPGQRPAEELSSALSAVGRDRALTAARAAPDSRLAAIAEAEAVRLRGGCDCVLALIVRADGTLLRELADHPRVRAVHAASPGTPRQELAISPLLPEQHDVVGPVPDQGPVPPQISPR